MKEIVFRPLRRIKKTGKIVVASYGQWNAIRCANYSEFALKIADEFRSMPEDEFVYDSKGKQLFFFNYNPSDIPIFDCSEHYGNIRKNNKRFAIDYRDGHIHYQSEGIDIDGSPAFNHLTANYVATHYRDMNQFEPLTVGVVTHWLGWFLYNLQKVNLV